MDGMQRKQTSGFLVWLVARPILGRACPRCDAAGVATPGEGYQVHQTGCLYWSPPERTLRSAPKWPKLRPVWDPDL